MTDHNIAYLPNSKNEPPRFHNSTEANELTAHFYQVKIEEQKRKHTNKSEHERGLWHVQK